jgi:hypothetical protein
MLESRLQSPHWTRPLPALVQQAAVLLKTLPRQRHVSCTQTPARRAKCHDIFRVAFSTAD